MKKTSQLTLCYRDSDFENQTRQQLETARQSLVNLLSEWQKLDIGQCDLHELLLRPELCYKKGIDSTIEIPATSGKFATNREKYLSTLDLPDSIKLIQTAKAAQRQPFSAVEPLWQIVGNDVQLVDEEANELIESQNISCSDPEKIAIVEDLNKVCDLLNSLNHRLKNEILPYGPVTVNFFRSEKFSIKEIAGPTWEVSPNREYIRRIVQG